MNTIPNEIKFLMFLRYIIENKNILKPISEISSSSPTHDSKALINSKEKLINFDYIGESLFGKKASTMDSLYFRFNNSNKLLLYFIEFKGEKLDKISDKDYFKYKILPLTENRCNYTEETCPIDKLDKLKLKSMHEKYTDEISSQLKLKPIESIFIVLPKLYENYVQNSKIKEEYVIQNFKNYLIEKVKIRLMIVYVRGESYINNEPSSKKRNKRQIWIIKKRRYN